MIVATPRAYRRRSIQLRVLGLLLLIGVFFGGAHPAGAANDWCSRDPIISLFHDSSSAPYTLDIQVMVPFLTEVPGTATLDVTIPANVGSAVVEAGPGTFNLETRVAPTKPNAHRPFYDVDLVLLVPVSARPFPVRMMVTDPQRATVLVVDGMAGQKLRVSLPVGL